MSAAGGNERAEWSAVARAAVVAVLTALSAASVAHSQQSPPPQIAELRIGFGGYFKIGFWTPVSLVVQAGSEPILARVELVALDGDATPSAVRVPQSEPVSIGAGQRQTLATYVKVGRAASDLVANLFDGDRLVATRRYSTTDATVMRALASTQEFYLVIGSTLSEVDALAWEQRRVQAVAIPSLEGLPDDWWGFEGVDAVMLLTAGSGPQFAADSPQLAALDRWVRLGGRLVMSVAQEAESLLGASTPIARLAPGKLENRVPFRRSSLLEAYAETSESLEVAGPVQLQVPRLSGVRGKIEAFDGNNARDLPLVVRSAYGFGEVSFAAFDLDRPPLAGWAGKPQLLDRLLRRPRFAPSVSDAGTLGQVTTLGFVDLAGQLRGALDQFEGVHVAPFWLVAVLVVGYIVAIGPLDYFLVKRLFRRMEATWLTFAAWALLFGGAAYALAYGFKGHEVRVNRVDLIDVDVESGLVRGTSWANLFSPASASYDLALGPAPGVQFESSQVLFSWFGLSGSGFGGMDPPPRQGINRPTGNFVLFTDPYYYADGFSRLRDVPLATWSSKAFIGRWSSEARPMFESHLNDRGKLVGSLASRLDFTLTDAVLMYDRWAYVLGNLAPGRTIDLETQFDPQTVETYLRQVKVRGDTSVSAVYDRSAFDIPRIMEVMSAHELAGGERYTRLTNQFQPWLDLSSLVRVGRAVLLGRREGQAAQLAGAGQPLDDLRGQHGTYYRFVLPVEGPSGLK